MKNYVSSAVLLYFIQQLLSGWSIVSFSIDTATDDVRELTVLDGEE